MKKLTLFTLLAMILAVPLGADDSKHQSYISFDDGGTLLRPADDDREIEARVNLPIFPGDEVITNRRGRTEIRLADGNVLGIDRATAVRFVSILDSYEGDASETIAELRYGKVAVYRIDDTRDYLRLDTPSASYFASNEAIFSVETDSRGRDRVAVFDGAIEVRTPARTTRLRSGEQAEVDDDGMYETSSYSRHSADDFESWFLRRSERYGASDSRYLDRSLAYYDDELSRNGSWVHINSYGWAWRPTVGAGWRPYYNGYWMRGRSGCLTWVSYEPWGWVPYHYGRWSHDPFYGWFWLPGMGYAPAWVYWWYGNGYMGWAPSGYWDAYRPYHGWNYDPYQRAGLSIGFGFYGRVRVNDVDLRPWTFIDANTIHSNRVDRAALTTDAIRDRLSRDRGGFATVSSDPARFTREEFRDPAAAINRRWVNADTGRAGAGPAAVPDVTPYIRRDNEIPAAIRDRVTRNRTNPGTSGSGRTTTAGGGGGGLAPIGGGSVAPIGGGQVAPIGGGSVAPIGRTDRSGEGRDRVTRGTGSRGNTGNSGAVTPNRGTDTNRGSGATRGDDSAGRVRRGNEGGTRDFRSEDTPKAPEWRERVTKPRDDEPSVKTPEAPTRGDNWRGRVVRPSEGGERAAPPPSSDRATTPSSSKEVPRRVIDRIGGARVESGERSRATRESGSRDGGSSSRGRSVDRSSSSGRSSSSPPPRASSGGGESRSSGSSSGSNSGASRSSGGESRSSGSTSRSGGESGRIKRDQ